MEKPTKQGIILFGIIAFTAVIVYFFTACSGDDDPPYIPQDATIPAEYQNTTWTNVDGTKLTLGTNDVTITLTNGTTTTYTYTGIEISEGKTGLRFDTHSDVVGMVVFRDGTLLGVVFPVLVKTGGWSDKHPVENISNPISAKGLTSFSLYVGQSTSLDAWITPWNAENRNVTWSSSNPAVATVTDFRISTGRNFCTLTAVAVGTATITVTTQENNKTGTCTVTVVAE
jgi:uncharacterized protein YjdB